MQGGIPPPTAGGRFPPWPPFWGVLRTLLSLPPWRSARLPASPTPYPHPSVATAPSGLGPALAGPGPGPPIPRERVGAAPPICIFAHALLMLCLCFAYRPYRLCALTVGARSLPLSVLLPNRGAMLSAPSWCKGYCLASALASASTLRLRVVLETASLLLCAPVLGLRSNPLRFQR